ncbi:hypothetical protein HanIR_Chr10g0457931 [Helianthus annuus]|nr:hypothetical protein HanIR_Chr10g0457931 [Helianthus annuus]
MVVGLCQVTATTVNSDDGYSMTVLSNDGDHSSGRGGDEDGFKKLQRRIQACMFRFRVDPRTIRLHMCFSDY